MNNIWLINIILEKKEYKKELYELFIKKEILLFIKIENVVGKDNLKCKLRLIK